MQNAIEMLRSSTLAEESKLPAGMTVCVVVPTESIRLYRVYVCCDLAVVVDSVQLVGVAE